MFAPELNVNVARPIDKSQLDPEEYKHLLVLGHRPFPGTLSTSYPTYVEVLEANHMLEELRPKNPDCTVTNFWAHHPPMDHRVGDPEVYRFTRDKIWRRQTPKRFELDPKGSWRRMLITNPPCEIVQCCVVFFRPGRAPGNEQANRMIWFTLRNQEGIKFGQIEDAAHDALVSERQNEHEDRAPPQSKIGIFVDFVQYIHNNPAA